MLFRTFALTIFATMALTAHASSTQFVLQGTSENDYRPALETAVQRLATLLTIEPSALPPLTIVVNRSSSESDTYQGPADLVLADDLLAKKQRGNETMASVVAHEACHLWLIELAKAQGLDQTKQGYLPSYGHSKFNDWFDELVAVRCEQGDLATQRRATDFEFIPLAKYLVQTHPVYERMQAQINAALAAQKAKQNGKNGDQTVLKLTIKDDNFGDFYRQSAYFAEFLTTLAVDLQLQDWLALAQHEDPEQIAKRLNFKNLSEMEQAFYQFIPW
ncbi:hypothetical protein [Pseudidiomarina sp. CB1]|uniref:hypothetical protein n=1 Tax=Pseudidiomarina sp. CB1 TaxID=2972484 RepID=UPI002162C2E2|nr:hypothetical protein [Pseudidiomarina sp. CB1]